MTFRISRATLFLFAIFFCSLTSSLSSVASPVPGDDGCASRQGKTVYVSKLGDNSDGSSWDKAFHTIQAALSAVPDAEGGHRAIVWPGRCRNSTKAIFPRA